MAKKGVALIGMPGSGKSTIGALLAEYTGRQFIDADDAIESAYGGTLQDIMDKEGYETFLGREEKALLSLNPQESIISTGGSAVYSEPGMQHLAKHAHIVYLQLDLATIESRVNNLEQRGIARQAGESLAELYARRVPLYEKWAELTVDCAGLSAAETAERIAEHTRS